MSRRARKLETGAMLDLWRPPKGAGDPVGCLASTYTFAPGLFDEQCLARFLEIESEPDREDLAFLLERECRLGGIYAGVLVDHTQAGVEHSLRWDVLPVRIRAGKQHAKLSLLVWSQHIRVVVASANLTEQGYRSNYEVAVPVDGTPDDAPTEFFLESLAFLRSLMNFVPGRPQDSPELRRAKSFLDHVQRRVEAWTSRPRSVKVRQRLVCTLPAFPPGGGSRSTLDEMIQVCRARGGSPIHVRVASPFFDEERGASAVTASLCKAMARGGQRKVCFCVPEVWGDDESNSVRLAAPKSLLQTPLTFGATPSVQILPPTDAAGNRRPWHAKLVGLAADDYDAVMVGSSNFTCAGMGISAHRNAEANLLTLVNHEAFSREAGRLEAVWPECVEVPDPDSAEWMGARPEDEAEEGASVALPMGFLPATFRAGDQRHIVLRFVASDLPPTWGIRTCGSNAVDLLTADAWTQLGCPESLEVAWHPVQAPERLMVRWDDAEGFLTMNVEDGGMLPPPARLQEMSSDDMLGILAASDPSAAFRAWTRRFEKAGEFNDELDSAIPADLDPLRRYDLRQTFLHRVRHRASVLAGLRSNVEQPVWSGQALEWRLRGLIGIEALANRLVQEFLDVEGGADEALLTIADLFIVLGEVKYRPAPGALSKDRFESLFRPFLGELAGKLRSQVATRSHDLSNDVATFWNRVMDRCLV